MPSVVQSSKAALTNGLRPESFSARDSQFLTKCLNRRVTDDGLKAFYAITQPMTDNYLTSTLGEVKSWPFPQIIRGKAITLLCFSDAIYLVDESTYLCTIIDTKDAAYPSGSTSKSITAGKDWHFVDFYGTWMLFNGACVIFKTGHSPYTFVQDAVTIKTGACHKEGRLLLGGFSASNFYTTVDWASYWNALADTMPTQYDTLAETGPRGNWVWWSSIMAPDMLQMFLQDLLIYGSPTLTDTGFTTDRPLILGLIERNEAGMRPMPFQGDVVGFLPLGEGEVCYGVDGIRFMSPYNESVIKTYGVHEFNGLGPSVGVMAGTTCRTAFGGNRARHRFVDRSGEIWQLTADLRAERLGYSEYIGAMDTAKILVQHDPHHDELYISDGTIGYLLTEKNRMCRCPSMPTALTSFSGSSLSSIKYATGSPTAMDIESGTFTTPSGGVETITAANVVGLNSASNGYSLTIKTRSKQTEDFYESAAVTLDGRTRANLAIPCTQYRWHLQATTASGVTVEDVQIELGAGMGVGIDAKLAASTPSAAGE